MPGAVATPQSAPKHESTLPGSLAWEAVNALRLKINQIGTVAEAPLVAKLEGAGCPLAARSFP